MIYFLYSSLYTLNLALSRFRLGGLSLPSDLKQSYFPIFSFLASLLVHEFRPLAEIVIKISFFLLLIQ
jgi:hypothetical protein